MFVTLDPWVNSFLVIRSHQSLSCVRLFDTPWIAAHQTSLSITNSQSSLKLMSIESVIPSSHFILCRPLLLLPPVPPSIRVFSNESTLRMRWPKYWSFSFSILPSKEIPGLISFRMDWLDLLAVQGTLKSLLQCHSSKALVLQRSAPGKGPKHVLSTSSMNQSRPGPRGPMFPSTHHLGLSGPAVLGCMAGLGGEGGWVPSWGSLRNFRCTSQCGPLCSKRDSSGWWVSCTSEPLNLALPRSLSLKVHIALVATLHTI